MLDHQELVIRRLLEQHRAQFRHPGPRRQLRPLPLDVAARRAPLDPDHQQQADRQRQHRRRHDHHPRQRKAAAGRRLRWIVTASHGCPKRTTDSKTCKLLFCSASSGCAEQLPAGARPVPVRRGLQPRQQLAPHHHQPHPQRLRWRHLLRLLRAFPGASGACHSSHSPVTPRTSGRASKPTMPKATGSSRGASANNSPTVSSRNAAKVSSLSRNPRIRQRTGPSPKSTSFT